MLQNYCFFAEKSIFYLLSSVIFSDIFKKIFIINLIEILYFLYFCKKIEKSIINLDF